ncbi:RNA dependent RNA polymerase [Bacillus velezensis]|uniref:RNA dependent RNA polymerase n=1 Tax=Bacillus velezensis TaxID=492670 RepID=UPI0034D571B5
MTNKQTDKQLQYSIFSLETSDFYNDHELKIEQELMKLSGRLKRFKAYQFKLQNREECSKRLEFIVAEIPKMNKSIGVFKKKIKDLVKSNNDKRELRQDAIQKVTKNGEVVTNLKKVIKVFDSSFTRSIKIQTELINGIELSEDIIQIKVYRYEVLEELLKNGFTYKGHKYIYLTSSAGMIRNKKTMWIKESKWKMHQDTLTCGLSVEEINRLGGCNINKYQSYLALNFSATKPWQRFNIDKAIVVDDLETDVTSEVDYIDKNTFDIHTKQMNIPIEHTDGCGMILPKRLRKGETHKAFICRLPWIKGLLVPFDFKKFAGDNSKIKDIYGKEWDIVKDDVQIIFTKSQFKMWKYYSSWDSYKDNFKKYNCEAAKMGEDTPPEDVRLTYQILQTLTDVTDKELKQLVTKSMDEIENIGSSRGLMLNLLGATKSNQNKNYFQEALYIYPELLTDPHAKQAIKDKQKSMVNDAKKGKLKTNGTFTYIIPDLYAFCEKLFLNQTPIGLIKNNECYCSRFGKQKLDVLRSPHLYMEHCIRQNVIDEQRKEWFLTEGIYTSIQDPISKILQFDNDGDKGVVSADPLLIEIAERNVKRLNVRPLYYEMDKAEPAEINSDSIFTSLKYAYKANIGVISNDISKIWNRKANQDETEEKLKVIKWLCMVNNFEIDAAKTLIKLRPPKHIRKTMAKYIGEKGGHKKGKEPIKVKLPYFFTYAKDKELHEVEEKNNSTVNRIEDFVYAPTIRYRKAAGKFNFRYLQYRPYSENQADEEDVKLIKAKYDELNKKKRHSLSQELESKDEAVFHQYLRNTLLSLELNKPTKKKEQYISDILIEYLYREKESRHKTSLWGAFGEEILKNLKKNVEGTIQCVDCGNRIKKVTTKKYCEKCAKKAIKKRATKLKQTAS